MSSKGYTKKEFTKLFKQLTKWQKDPEFIKYVDKLMAYHSGVHIKS